MSFENDGASNLPELTPITSNQHVKNSTITKGDSSASVSLKAFIEQQAAIPSNIDKLTNTFCDQLTNLSSILLMLNRHFP